MKTRKYKTFDGLKKALKKVIDDTWNMDYTYNRNRYGIIYNDDIKVLEFLNIAINYKFKEWRRQKKNYFSVIGYRVSPQIIEILNINKGMINDVKKYLKY